MAAKRDVHIGAHVRNGSAVGDYTQKRDVRDPDDDSSAAVHGAHADPLKDMADDHGGAYDLSPAEWQSLIVDHNDFGPPQASEAYRPDGTVDVGKRQLVVSVNHRFTHHYDDQATAEIEEIPSEFEAREIYRIAVPDGARFDYATIRAATEAHTSERFSPMVEDKTYGAVAVESVMVQEWEVVDDPDPRKLWHRQRDTWADGHVDYA